MKNAALRLGKGCRGTTSSCSTLSVGLHRLRGPGLTVPSALLPAGCLPPTDVQSRAASWLHSLLHMSSLRTRGPGTASAFFLKQTGPSGAAVLRDTSHIRGDGNENRTEFSL